MSICRISILIFAKDYVDKKNGKFFKKKMWKQNKIFVYKGLFRNILNTINVVVAKKKKS